MDLRAGAADQSLTNAPFQARIAIPEAFLAADAVALIFDNIMGGIVVRAGDTVIDGSVRRRLAVLKKAMS